MTQQIYVNNSGDMLTICTPYNAEFIAAIKSLGGMWDGRQKVWIASTKKEDEVNALVEQYFGEELHQQERAERQHSTIMRYKDQVLYNVRSVLWNIKEHGGLAGTKFLQSEYQRLRGEWPADIINVAMVCIGRGIAFEGKATPDEMTVFVEAAKQDNEALLRQIADLREAKGK